MKPVEEHIEEPKSPSLEDLLQTYTRNSSYEESETLESQSLYEQSEEEESEALENQSLHEQSEELTQLKKRIKKVKIKSLNNPSSYEILDLNKGASQEEIRDRYLELVKIAHTDKGGDEDTFNAISKAFKTLYKDKTDNVDEGNDENNEEDEQVGLHLIIGKYTPYISHSAFCDLKIEAEQKELVLLLGRQRRIYCKELISKYNGIDLKLIDADTINFNSVDLDSAYLSPENQEKIVYLSQKANLSRHSLNGMQAITTEIASPDVPGLYLMGWKLLHEKPAMDSGALKLFKTWNRDQRKGLAIAIGNEKTKHMEIDITGILDIHDPSKEPSLAEKKCDSLLNMSFDLIASKLIQKGYINTNDEDVKIYLYNKLCALPAHIIKLFFYSIKKMEACKFERR